GPARVERTVREVRERVRGGAWYRERVVRDLDRFAEARAVGAAREVHVAASKHVGNRGEQTERALVVHGERKARRVPEALLRGRVVAVPERRLDRGRERIAAVRRAEDEGSDERTRVGTGDRI